MSKSDTTKEFKERKDAIKKSLKGLSYKEASELLYRVDKELQSELII